MAPIKTHAGEGPDDIEDDGTLRKKGEVYLPTSEKRLQVQTMAGLGLPEEQIAMVLRVHKNTLRNHHAHDLAQGRVVANQQVAEALFQSAIRAKDASHNTTAAIFWAKCRMGWKPDSSIELPAGPSVRTVVIQLGNEAGEASEVGKAEADAS